MPLIAKVIGTEAELAPLIADWDALAVSNHRPYCAPAWMLAWWRHGAEPGARLRVVAVHDETELVALAPFYAAGRPATYRVLASAISHRVEPVARPGREEEAAGVIARALADERPRPGALAFEHVDTRVGWSGLLAGAWPGRSPVKLLTRTDPAPTVSLEASDFDAWMAGKSRNFRSQTGRIRRRLEAKDAQFRCSETADELEADLADFARLHYSRWENRGGTVALNSGVESMLLEAGRSLLVDGRMRLYSIRVDGRTISAYLFLAAGEEVTYWNGGFDEAFATDQPSMQTLLSAVADCFARHDGRLDLGGGGQPYKYRLADGEEVLESHTLAIRNSRYLLTRAQLAPRQLKYTVATRLSPRWRHRLKALIGRAEP